MKLNSLVFLFLFCVSVLHAQVNLVPNFSFEQYDTCPTMEDQAEFATGWNKCSTSNGVTFGNTTPDYYNACAPTNGLGVPQSFAQFQPDRRNCGAYMGLITYSQPTWSEYREQVGIQLTTPMIIGQKYYLSFYVVMAGQKNGPDYYDHPSNNVGMRLSTIFYNPTNPAPIDNFAHLRSVSVISDTVNWVRISGSIIADSAYTYIMLGNFYDDLNTDTILYNCGTCYNYYSYYLVDDICVSTDSILCNGGIDLLPCIVSVPEITSSEKISIFPNPATDIVTLSFLNNQSDEIVITDMFGDIYYSQNIAGKNDVSLSLATFPSGIYILRIVNLKENKSISQKIIKI